MKFENTLFVLDYPPGYYTPTTTEAPNYPAAYGYVARVYKLCAENEFLNAKNECEPMVRI